MTPHPANLWVGEPNEAEVDRLLYAVDEDRRKKGLPTIGTEPGAGAQALLGMPTVPAQHRDLPPGDAYEGPDDEDQPPPGE